jgi:hypothetical protein
LALKELISHDVAYRKLVSPSPSELLPDDHFRLYAVCARFPHNLAGQVPWEQVQAGGYDCRWVTDTVRVVVARELPREAHHAPLHLFSAAPDLVSFGRGVYQPRSRATSGVLGQLFERLQGEGFTMPFTMHDFLRNSIKEHFGQLTQEEQEEVLQSLPAETRLAGLSSEVLLAGLSPEQRQELREQLTAEGPAQPPKRRRKK